MRIPTAITRYKTKGDPDIGAWAVTFNRPINFVNDEVCQQYRFLHLVIRWSPVRVAIRRILRRG
jgi:hypothetical protein